MYVNVIKLTSKSCKSYDTQFCVKTLSISLVLVLTSYFETFHQTQFLVSTTLLRNWMMTIHFNSFHILVPGSFFLIFRVILEVEDTR